MKLYINYTIGCLLSIGALFSSCNYLDIVPDEGATEGDMTADRNSATNFLYSCYGYLPQPNNGTSSLDLCTGDEIVTAFEHETFASFPKGNYSASNPVISYWNTLFNGIRQCYTFIEKLDDPNTFKGLSDTDRADDRAQATFLIGYYHFLLVRSYGPVILVTSKPDPTIPPENYLPRSSYDDCVKFVCDKFDEAAALLPTTRSGDRASEFGLATSTAAKALKARMLLYAASPLFNGNSTFYANFKDNDGNALMPLTYDADKWTKARDAYKAAIDAAEGAGYKLYDRADNQINVNGYPADPHVRALRYTITDYTQESNVGGNTEVIWADSRTEGYYGMQNKTIPYVAGSSWAWNGISPTLSMLKRFYTKNGLPYEEDTLFTDDNMFQPIPVDEAHKTQAAKGEMTMAFNLDREPRYYAWIAFQGGFYEIMSAANNGMYNNDASYNAYSDSKHGELVCDFVLGGNCSRGSVSSPRTNNYAPTGFLNKKGSNPDRVQTLTGASQQDYPWPIVRLAELYLGYAEACIECNDLTTAKTYINKVRARAGIQSLENAWAYAKHPNNINTQAGMRDIVRQERMIELYLENHNFWDMRRWLLAEGCFGVKAQGMNIAAQNMTDFCEVSTVPFERKFESPTNYLMPIPSDDMNKNTHLVQNPGY